MEFRSLPLVEVSAYMRMEPQKWSFDRIVAVGEALGNAGLEVYEARTDEEMTLAPFRFRIGQPAGLFAKGEKGIMLEITARELKCRWQPLTPSQGYPRFESLQSVFNVGAEALSVRPLAVGITYVKHLKGLAPLTWPILKSPPLPNIDYWVDLNIAYTDQADVERRIQIQRQEPMMMATTTAIFGEAAKTRSPGDGLAHAHDLCGDWFLSLLTPEAKEHFGHQEAGPK